MLNILRNIFAVFGLISVVGYFVLMSVDGSKWEWSEIKSLPSPDNQVKAVLELGKHNDAINRIRVVLHLPDGVTQEVWSSYEKTSPAIEWKSDTNILITYDEEESHTYWPSVSIKNGTYNVSVQFRR